MNSYETAITQRENHREQVSGVWSINAENFCKTNNLDYDSAVDYQIMREAEDQEDYEAGIIDSRQRELGYLTDIQMDKIRKDAEGVGINDNGYSFYFWDNIVEQLEAEK